MYYKYFSILGHFDDVNNNGNQNAEGLLCLVMTEMSFSCHEKNCKISNFMHILQIEDLGLREMKGLAMTFL